MGGNGKGTRFFIKNSEIKDEVVLCSVEELDKEVLRIGGAIPPKRRSFFRGIGVDHDHCIFLRGSLVGVRGPALLLRSPEGKRTAGARNDRVFGKVNKNIGGAVFVVTFLVVDRGTITHITLVVMVNYGRFFLMSRHSDLPSSRQGGGRGRRPNDLGFFALHKIICAAFRGNIVRIFLAGNCCAEL